MITKIEASNFRSLKRISQHLADFQILVGPNATGKTTFLDVVGLISDIVNEGIDTAVNKRVNNYKDLSFAAQGGEIELAIEIRIPTSLIDKLGENKAMRFARYELCIGIDNNTEELAIFAENLYLMEEAYLAKPERQMRLSFPEFHNDSTSILLTKALKAKKILAKEKGGNDSYYPEIYQKGSGGWLPSFKLGPKKSALANLPADEEKFPVSVWLKETLEKEIQFLMLNSLKIRQASAPNQGKRFLPDGSNLPWMIDLLKKENPQKFNRWLQHITQGSRNSISILVFGV